MLERLYHKERIPLAKAFGAEYPEYFLSPAAEYRALVRSCGVIDLTHRRVLVARGRDRAGFLDAMLTNDVASLQVGQGVHSLMTTAEGKIVSEVFVFARESEHLVVVSQGGFDETLSALKDGVAGKDVAIEDASAERGILGVEGPEARRVIHRLLGTGPLPARAFGILERGFEKFSVLAMQSSATGEIGFHVVVPAREVPRIRDYLLQAARGSDGLPVGLEAWNARRVEAGLPWYGSDFAEDDFPDEVRLGGAVSHAKATFRGREALLRLRRQGKVKSALTGFVPEEDGFVEMTRGGSTGQSDVGEDLDLRGLFARGLPIYRLGDVAAARDHLPAETERVGFVTSAVFSPALRKPLLMGRVERKWLDGEPNVFAVHTTRGPLTLRKIELPLAGRKF